MANGESKMVVGKQEWNGTVKCLFGCEGDLAPALHSISGNSRVPSPSCDTHLLSASFQRPTRINKVNIITTSLPRAQYIRRRFHAKVSIII